MVARLSEAVFGIDEILAKAKLAGTYKIIAQEIEGMDIDGLRVLSDKIKARENSAVTCSRITIII